MDLGHGTVLLPESPARARAAEKLSPEYREVIERTVALLRETKARLHSVTAGEAPSRADAQVLAASRNLWSEWRTAWSDAMQCMPEILANPEQLRLAKSYTEAHLTAELSAAPLWRQAYQKPLGYPGDYLVMDYIYRGGQAGETPFGGMIHELAVEIGQFVVKRKDLIRRAIAKAVARHPGTATCVVASLGCGPAEEIADFLRFDAGGAPAPHFILVDHDSAALRYAGRRLADAAAGGGECAARIDLRHLSVLRLLREVDPASLLAQADIIYSAGLFDYFSDRTCRVLTRRLYATLRPGGLLLLGNMKSGSDMIWPLEMIADWSLCYRSAETVMAWADGLPGAEISLRTEATGYDFLLSLRKT